jgi:hypothetical protein
MMPIGDRFRSILCGILASLPVCVLIIILNCLPYTEHLTRCYGFPFTFLYVDVVNQAEVFGDGGTLVTRRSIAILHYTYDELGLIANVSIGILLALSTWIATCIVLKKRLPPYS